MNQGLTRRRFGQLAIASTTVAGLGYLAKKTLAQVSNLMLLGVKAEPAAKGAGIKLLSLELATNQIQTLPLPPAPSGPILGIGDELGGFTCLSDGTLVLAINHLSTSASKGNPSTRLTFLGKKPRVLTLSGLGKLQKVDGLQFTKQGVLNAIVLTTTGRPPVTLVDIDLQSGQISDQDRVSLPQNERFITLAECSEGKLHTITTGQKGETALVKLDQDSKQPNILSSLQFNNQVLNNGLQDNNQVLNNGLQDVSCTPTDQFLGLGAPRYVSPNSLYAINPKTGVTTQLVEFPVNKIAYCPVT